MSLGKATAVAHANIAFIKYWGVRDAARRLPANNSLSMNLDAAYTTTTVEFAADYRQDVVVLDGVEAAGRERARVAAVGLALRLTVHGPRSGTVRSGRRSVAW